MKAPPKAAQDKMANAVRLLKFCPSRLLFTEGELPLQMGDPLAKSATPALVNASRPLYWYMWTCDTRNYTVRELPRP